MIINIYLTQDYKSFEENQCLKINEELLLPPDWIDEETKASCIKIKDDYDRIFYVEKKYIDMISINY